MKRLYSYFRLILLTFYLTKYILTLQLYQTPYNDSENISVGRRLQQHLIFMTPIFE